MKRTLLVIIFGIGFSILVSIVSLAWAEPVYLGMAMTINDRPCVLLEDQQGLDRADYDKYFNYVKGLALKYASPNEVDNNYYIFIKDYKPGFKKLSNLQPGEKFYLSRPNGVIQSKIYGYALQTKEYHSGLNIFYPVLENPGTTGLNDRELAFSSDKLVVCSRNSKMTRLKTLGIKDQKIKTKFKIALLPLLKKVEITNYENKKQSFDPLRDLDDDELKIFAGHFTGLKEEYLISFSKRGYAGFTSASYIMDATGKVINIFSKLHVDDFSYCKVIGIIDVNGDGIDELLTEDGYYEGRSNSAWQLKNGKYQQISFGFNIGA